MISLVDYFFTSGKLEDILWNYRKQYIYSGVMQCISTKLIEKISSCAKLSDGEHNTFIIDSTRWISRWGGHSRGGWALGFYPSRGRPTTATVSDTPLFECGGWRFLSVTTSSCGHMYTRQRNYYFSRGLAQSELLDVWRCHHAWTISRTTWMPKHPRHLLLVEVYALLCISSLPFLY